MIRDHKHVRKYEDTKVRVVVPSSVRKYFRTFEGTVHVRVHVHVQHKIRVKIKQENVSVTSTNPTIDAHNACQTHPPERRRGERATLRRC